MIKKMKPLEPEHWQDHVLPFHYISRNYYDVEIKQNTDGFNVSFIKKPFDKPYEYGLDDNDKLFQPHWEDVKAWGIVEDDKLVAAIETAVEKWSNRLRVTWLWVDTSYQRKGIATALMDLAIKRAKEEKYRAVILETQTCNEAAIAFYLNYGFTLIGFDSCCYGNNDIQHKGVRIELGMML